MESLPKDVLTLIALHLDRSDILNLCGTSEYLNDKICNNKYFWLQKLKSDFLFHFDDYVEDGDPKKAYQLLYNRNSHHLTKYKNHTVYLAGKLGSKSLVLYVLEQEKEANFLTAPSTQHYFHHRNVEYGFRGSIESKNIFLIDFFVEEMKIEIQPENVYRAIKLNNIPMIKYFSDKLGLLK